MRTDVGLAECTGGKDSKKGAWPGRNCPETFDICIAEYTDRRGSVSGIFIISTATMPDFAMYRTECIKGDGEVEWGGLDMDAHPSLMQPWQTRWKFGPTANLPIVESYYVSDLEPRWTSMEAPSKVGYTRMESDQ